MNFMEVFEDKVLTIYLIRWKIKEINKQMVNLMPDFNDSIGEQP